MTRPCDLVYVVSANVSKALLRLDSSVGEVMAGQEIMDGGRKYSKLPESGNRYRTESDASVVPWALRIIGPHFENARVPKRHRERILRSKLMKHQMTRFTTFRLPGISSAICAMAATLFFAVFAQAQSTQILPPIGGDGGGQFVARCAESQYLAGVELRTGDDVDAIRPLCVKAYGPHETSAVPLTKGSGLRNTGVSTFLGPIQQLDEGWYGGPGGGLRNLVCPSDTPIVTGIYIGAEGVDTTVVNNIHLFCGIAASAQKPSDFPSAVFDGPYAKDTFNALGAGNNVTLRNDSQRCPSGLVGVGISGRSGVWLDAVGLICGEPKLSAGGPVKAVGRVHTGAPAGQPLSICESAREARARNSPAAPGLEAQCRNAGARGETVPVKAVGRTRTETPVGPVASICDSARAARARNSPAAAGLEEKCHGELAATGAAIAQMDEILAAARAPESDPMYRQGFDIATAIFGDPALGAQGHTAAGPGSLGIRDSLSAAGQRGFNAAMKLHLSRNYLP